MHLHSTTLPTLAQNIALDDALLATIEAGSGGEVLRVWEAPEYGVVLGRGSKRKREVDDAACERMGVPVERRSSGGATVLAGPGCLMYAVLLDRRGRDELRGIDGIHRYVLGRMVRAIGTIVPGVEVAGTSDLVVRLTDGTLRKFAGNSLRVRRHGALYHGTLLYDFDLSLIAKLLLEPPKQPDYRDRRPHDEFVMNIAVDRQSLVDALVTEWVDEI